MAAVTLRDVILYDRFPGSPNPNLGKPTNGFDSTVVGSGNCVSTPIFSIGEKIMAYNDGTHNPGYYTMCYLQFAEGSSSAYDIGEASDGYRVCGWAVEVSTYHPDVGTNNEQKWFVMTNNVTDSDLTTGCRVAIPACDLSGAVSGSNEWGWFWVGGVCPCITSPTVDCTKLGQATGVKTDGDVEMGCELAIESDGTAGVQFIPYCWTAVAELTEGAGGGDCTIWTSPLGWATDADA